MDLHQNGYNDGMYDDYLQQALTLQNHFHDAVDDPYHPQAFGLQREIHGLVNDFRERKDPRHAEQRLKVIDHELLQARIQGEKVMSYQDIEALQHQYRRLREAVSKMSR